MTLLNSARSIGRLLIILVATTPLAAALSSRRKSLNAITANDCSHKDPRLDRRAFLVPNNRRKSSRDTEMFCVHPTAFVTPSSSGGIAASSLFYPTETIRMRRRPFLNSHALIHSIRVTSNRYSRHVRIFMGESPSALDQQDQSLAAISALSQHPALDSRTDFIVHSLQGGASVTDDETVERHQNALGECVKQDEPNGSSVLYDETDTETYIHSENVDASNIPDPKNDNCISHSNNDKETNEREKTVLVHIYSHHDHHHQSNATVTMDNATLHYQNAMLVGVGMSQRQFATWVHYQLVARKMDSIDGGNTHDANSNTMDVGEQTTTDEKNGVSPLQLSVSKISNQIHSRNVDWEKEWESHIATLRQFWREERLLCEYTHILSPKRRANKIAETNDSSQEYNVNGQTDQERREEEERMIKSEQFKDALSSYAERMVSIVEDERSDIHHVAVNECEAQTMKREQNPHGVSNDDTLLGNPPRWNTSRGLLGWIEQEYGVENTQELMADSLLNKTEDEQLEKIHSFLTWFRLKFPYYHDKCDSCGASCKEASSITTIDSESDLITVEQETNEVPPDQADVDNLHVEEGEDRSIDDVSFLGYVYPSITERLGNASRTELYRCRSCDSFTRFPRYNRALWITHTRRGRCGEYSMLLYRFLRAMGYEKLRWVVDWADHVWVEVWLGERGGSVVNGTGMNGRWVHCDPCEASVDEPLLYQGWGKNQTYIVAFFDPFKNKSLKVESALADDRTLQNFEIPLVEDVTSRYTSDEVKFIHDRRGISSEFMSETIQEMSIRLSEMLSNHQR
eukprot:CCRYP_000719-RA/>CCRYP_000719-RA protein AED:0.01 eAED:0.01 QI:172/1/1/1/1/1/2/567/798